MKAQQFSSLRNEIRETVPLRTCLPSSAKCGSLMLSWVYFNECEGSPAAMQACGQQDMKNQSERPQTLS